MQISIKKVAKKKKKEIKTISQHAESFISLQSKQGTPLRFKHKHLITQFAHYLEEKLNNQKSSALQPSLTGPLKVALITEDVGHLTGGRYYTWFIALALVELGYDVTVYTNRRPVFQESFKGYKQPQTQVVDGPADELEDINIHADIYIGSPVSGNITAAKLGAKYNKPSFAIIFDPFPMMEKYLGQRHFQNWGELLGLLRNNNTKVISLCKATGPYIYDWLNKKPEDVIPVYPCVNSYDLDRSSGGKREDYVVFISRLVRHKKFEDVLYAVRAAGIRLKVISSIEGIKAEKLIKVYGLEGKVDFHKKCSDIEKFEIIKNSRGVINGSIFEGFGMWAAEALSCGVPLVCYEYPTTREMIEHTKADNVYMAEWDKKESLAQMLKKSLKESKFRPGYRMFDFSNMVERVREVFSITPKIGVITIAINEEKFIKASLKSVIKHPNVAKAVVVEGAVSMYPSHENGLSVDNTAGEVTDVMHEDFGEKVIFERYGLAQNKSELRNRALKLLPKDITHVLIVDADEVWKQEDLDRLVRGMRDNPRSGIFAFNFYHFWKQKDLVAVGGQWDSKMFRCFKYEDKDLHWDRHELPVVNSAGASINKTHETVILEDVHVYHYGAMKDKKRILEKLEFYKKRDKNLNVIDTWSNWKPGQDTQWTHGGGDVAKFEGEHPLEVKNIL